MDALKLALAASVAFTAGCPIFDDDPDPEYEYCSERFDVSDTPNLVFDVDSPAVTWQVEATFTGVGHDHRDYDGQFFDLRTDAVAVSNDPDVDAATLLVTVAEVGADEPWISAPTPLGVGDPRTPVNVNASLVEHLEAACDGMETCTLELEVRIESLAPAVIVLHQLSAQLRSSMNTTRFEGCGISEYAVEGGSQAAGSDSTG